MKLKPFKKYGNLDLANQHESDKETPIRLGSEGDKEEGETYIGLPARNGKNMTLNKIQHTKVGDDIHFYVNGVENRGVVVKMGGTYVSVFKEDGNVHEIPINETFFVKDILVNKTWDDMTDEERVDMLQKVHAYSPRFIQKNWDALPRELKTVLSEKATGLAKIGMEQNHDKDNLEVEDANHAQTGYAQTQQNTLGKGEDLGGEDSDLNDIGRNMAGVQQKFESLGKPTDIDISDTGNLGKGEENENTAEMIGHEGRHRSKESIDDSLKSILELKSDVEEGKYGNVGSTAEVLVSTDTPLDVSESTGYEDRPHLSLEDVGKLPRSNSKPHHSNEVKESNDKEILEPKYIKQDKKKQVNKVEGGQTGSMNTSEGGAFNPVYNAYDTPITPEETKTGRKIAGRDQLKKGVPLSNTDTWGLKYIIKGTGIKGKYMYGGKHVGDIADFDADKWFAHVTLHSMPENAEMGTLDEEASVITEDGKEHKDPRKLTSGGKFSATAMQQELGGDTSGEKPAAPAAPKAEPAQAKTWDEGVDSDVDEESKA
tara:strand:+ start:18 stop:1640 length:1623 start_codon:yes stop_codon:yes gene_type:complete